MFRSSEIHLDRQALYNIYKACRLCSTGEGYRMPIIQNVISVALNDVPLDQKIRECLNLKVSLQDRMPPLICEQCIEMVDDFYNFKDLCHQTDKMTRSKLGIPMKSIKNDYNKPQPDKSTNNTMSDDEISTIGNNKNNQKKDKLKKEDSKTENKPQTDVAVKNKKEINKYVKKEEQNVKSKAGPKCMKVKNELKTLQENQEKAKKPQKPGPQCSKGLSKEVLILQADQASLNYGKTEMQLKTSNNPSRKCLKGLQKELVDIKAEENASSRNLKRGRDKPIKAELPAKKSRQSEPIRQRQPSTPEKDVYTLRCPCCDQKFKNNIGLSNHMRTHPPTFTSDMFACNACRLWFVSIQETQKHHKQHCKKKPYTCQGCNRKFVTYILYNEHIDKIHCPRLKEVPDVICRNCKLKFPTANLRKKHKCTSQTWICEPCDKTFYNRTNLKRHQTTCSKINVPSEPIIDPEVKARLLNMQVRLAKCDPLLSDKKKKCDAKQVPYTYGLDKKFVYPYLSCIPNIKKESQFAFKESDAMVQINNDFIDIPVEEPVEYVHWDSDDSEIDRSAVRTPSKLSTLTIKAIYSPNFLGKAAKRQRVKREFDSPLTGDIDSLIENLDSDIKKDDSLDAWFKRRGDSEIKCHDFSNFDSLKEGDDSNDSFSLLNPCDNGAVIDDGGTSLDLETNKLIKDISNEKVVINRVNNDSEMDTCSENEEDLKGVDDKNSNNELKKVELDKKDDSKNNVEDKSDANDTNVRDDDEAMNTDSQETIIEENNIDRNTDLNEVSENVLKVESSKCNVDSKMDLNDELETSRKEEKSNDKVDLNKDSNNTSDLKEEDVKDLNSVQKPDLVEECEEIISNIININSLNSNEETTKSSENIKGKDNENVPDRIELNNEISENDTISNVEESNALIETTTDDDLSQETIDHEETSQEGSSQSKDIDKTQENKTIDQLNEFNSMENDSSDESKHVENNSINDNETQNNSIEKTDNANENSEIDDSTVGNHQIQSDHNFECKNVSNNLQIEEKERIANGNDDSDSKDRVMDDKELMDELDAQIAGYGGEGETENDDKNSSNDKMSLNDLINVKGDDLTSLNLDNISDDDFDFDV